MELEKVATGEFEDSFVGLVDGADFVIGEGCAALFNVGAEDVGDRPGFGELDQTVDAFDIGGEVANVETAGVEGIAGEEEAGETVIKGEVGGVVAGYGNCVENAAAEVDFSELLGPAGHLEGCFDGFGLGWDDGCVMEGGKFFVAGGVVGVGVGMDDEKGWDGTVGAFCPLGEKFGDEAVNICHAGAGVLEKGPLFAEKEEEKGLFVVGAATFADDVEIGVVLVDLPGGYFGAIGTAGAPLAWEGAGLQSFDS